jgi:hypothetical protein
LGLCAFLDLFRRTDAEQEIRQRKPSRILDPLFLRTGIAEIHFLHLSVDDLGQKDCRIITFANVAQHLDKLDLELPEKFNSGHLKAPSAPSPHPLRITQESECPFRVLVCGND